MFGRRIDSVTGDTQPKDKKNPLTKICQNDRRMNDSEQRERQKIKRKRKKNQTERKKNNKISTRNQRDITRKQSHQLFYHTSRTLTPDIKISVDFAVDLTLKPTNKLFIINKHKIQLMLEVKVQSE